MAETVSTACPHCDAKLKVKAEKIGKTATCPGCQQLIKIEVLTPTVAPIPALRLSGSDLPATEKQKQFATSLGCEFSDSITRGEISSLIERGKERQEQGRYESMVALQNREQSAIAAVRTELLQEMSDDPQVSMATVRQMVDSLDDQNLAAILITMPFDQIDEFHALNGVDVRITSSNSMSDSEVVSVLQQITSKVATLSPVFVQVDPRQFLQDMLQDWRDHDSKTERPENRDGYLGDSEFMLLGFDVISVDEVEVGSLMAVPPRPVLREFLAIAGVALTARPNRPQSILQTKLSPGKVSWTHRRYVIREFVDDMWFIFKLDN